MKNEFYDVVVIHFIMTPFLWACFGACRWAYKSVYRSIYRHAKSVYIKPWQVKTGYNGVWAENH